MEPTNELLGLLLVHGEDQKIPTTSYSFLNLCTCTESRIAKDSSLVAEYGESVPGIGRRLFLGHSAGAYITWNHMVHTNSPHSRALSCCSSAKVKKIDFKQAR